MINFGIWGHIVIFPLIVDAVTRFFLTDGDLIVRYILRNLMFYSDCISLIASRRCLIQLHIFVIEPKHLFQTTHKFI